MALRWSLAILTLLTVSTAAHGYTTENMLPHCNSRDELCTGYLLAVVDAESERDSARQFCMPKGIDVDQVASIFVRYAAGHPEALSHSAAHVAGMGLRQRFPCNAAR